MGRGRAFGEGRLAPDDDGRGRYQVEQVPGAPFGIAQDGLVTRQQLRAGIGFLRLLILLQAGYPVLDRTLHVAQRRQQTRHFLLDARHFAQAGRVHLRWCFA